MAIKLGKKEQGTGLAHLRIARILSVVKNNDE